MRELLLELYIKHGERVFRDYAYVYSQVTPYGEAYRQNFLSRVSDYQLQLTPKAIEYIKNLDNP